MKVKTSEATGLQLDWGVAVVLGVKPKVYCGRVKTVQLDDGDEVWKCFSHTDPAVCMGLIKEHCIQLFTFTLNGQRFWDATISGAADAIGCDTPEIAVARCVISMKLGDEFEVPDELEVM